MINMIFAHYAEWIIPRGQFFSDFWIYFTDRPSKHIGRGQRLTRKELDFMVEAVRNNQIIKSYSGILYKCVDSKSQFDLTEREREHRDRAFQGYHKKGKSHGKKKAVTHSRRGRVPENGEDGKSTCRTS